MKKKVVIGIPIAIMVVAVGVILWLIIEGKKKMQKKDAEIKEKDDLIIEKDRVFIELEAQRASWQNVYYNQSAWIQDLVKQIPNPDEAIKEIILNLENLKKRVFSERENYVKEIDTAIHSLKGNALHLSFSVIAKIMENLLEDKLMENADFKERYKVKLEKKGRKNLNFGNLIDFAKDKEYFDENSVILLNEIKVLRNDSVHEISPDTDQNILIIFHNKMIELIAYVEFETWGVTQVEEEEEAQLF